MTSTSGTSKLKKPFTGRFIPSRRAFIWGSVAAVTAAACGVGVYTFKLAPHWLSVKHVDMPLANLPSYWVGKRIAQLSDLHVGQLVDFDYLVSAMNLTNSLQPDMTLITGDFMSCRDTEQVDQVGRVLSHLTPAPLGCYAVTGNHDYGNRWSNTKVADRLETRLTQANIQLLRNRKIDVQGLQILGVDDLWSPTFNPAAAFKDADWAKPAITLCHNPDAVDLPSFSAVRGWVLSGHTHGGQCKPPFLPPPILPVKNKRYTQGAFDIGPSRRLYINPGVGYIQKARFLATPEITLFTLRQA